MPKKTHGLENDELPIFEITFEDDGKQGINFLSLVSDPAIEVKGMYFNKPKNQQFKAIEEEMMVVGPAMIPDEKIYRQDGDYGYFVVFSKETIKRMQQAFNRKNKDRRINVDHTSQVVDAFIDQNWLIEDKQFEQSRKYGYDLPIGTWFVKVKIDDEKFWEEDVKEMGKYSFSIEGIMGTTPYQMIKQYNFEALISKTRDLLKNIGPLTDDELFKVYTYATRGVYRVSFDFDGVLSTPQGQAMATNEIKNGNEVFVVTKRAMINQSDVYAVSDKLGIPRQNVVFTDGKYKYKYLRNLFIDCHYDDTQEEIDKINRSSGVLGKLFSVK